MTVNENVINATTRTVYGSSASKRIRKQDKCIPGIVYSLKGENLKITLKVKEWDKLAKKDIQIIKLNIDTQKTMNVLLKDVQFNVLSDTTLHIDLQEIDMNEEVTAAVAVHPHGNAAGASKGGILTQIEHEVEVSCLPSDLPDSIDVDVTALELDECIHAKDLIFPENVKIACDPEMLVIRLAPPKVKEEETDTEEGEEETEAVKE